MFILNISLLLPVFIFIHLSTGIQCFAVENLSIVGITSTPENNNSPLNSIPPSNIQTSTFPRLVVNQLRMSPSINQKAPTNTAGTSKSESPAVFPLQNSPDENGKFSLVTETSAFPINAVSKFTLPEIVISFALPFIQQVKSDQKLYKAFALQNLSEEEAKHILYDIVFNDHSNTGAENQSSSARLVSETLAANYKHVTTDSVIGFYAYTVGKYLFYHDLLTPETVRYLSEKYLNKIRDNVYSVANFSQETAFRAIAKGFIEFMMDFTLYRKDNAESFARYIAIEIQNLRKYRTDISK